MLDLKKYTTDQLYTMQDVLEEVDRLLEDYVTSEFAHVTGLQDLVDRLMIEIDERMEDMENAQK